MILLQCDVVSGYKDTKEDIENILEDMLPTLEIKSITSLSDKGK